MSINNHHRSSVRLSLVRRKTTIAAPNPAENHEMSGRLQKMGVVNKSFKERWFVLSGNKLFYYKSKDANAAIHFIPLEESYVRVSQDHHPNSHCFEVVTGSRIFQLVAPSEKAMHEWIHSIQKYSNITNCDNHILSLVEDVIISNEIEFAKRMLEIEEQTDVTHEDNSSNEEELQLQQQQQQQETEEPWAMIDYCGNTIAPI
jgi:hypothetical protein